MNRKLQIARHEVELGWLEKQEAVELLREGFLLPTDVYREEGTEDWRFLEELDRAAKGKPVAKAVFQKVVSAGEAAASQAVRLTGKLASVAKQGGKQASQTTARMLDAFTPQIRKLVSRQMLATSVGRVRSAVQDDAFMRKVFGATYDCLPKPVHRFVGEVAFVNYCMERRERLWPTHKEIEDAQSSQELGSA